MNNVLKEFNQEQKELIYLLHRRQAEFGYISPEAVAGIADRLNISESEVFGVLTFFKAFSLKPRGKHCVTICTGTACHVRGAPRIVDEFSRELNIQAGETTTDDLFTLETVNCVGACALGPIVIIDGAYHGQVKTTEVEKLIDGCRNKE